MIAPSVRDGAASGTMIAARGADRAQQLEVLGVACVRGQRLRVDVGEDARLPLRITSGTPDGSSERGR